MSLLLYYFLLYLSLFFKNSHGGKSPPSSVICPTYNCGNGIMIRYPFWLINNTTSNQYCGYPNFGLSCSNNEPILTLQSDKFYVKDINYTASTITLVSADFSGQPCPRASKNVTLGNLTLIYSNLNLKLSFYFNCSSSPFSFFSSPIQCLGFGTMQSYVIQVDNGPSNVNWEGICEANVVVTVIKSNISSNGLVSGFGWAMNQGFMLDWVTPVDCRACEAYKGLCMYSDTQKRVLCSCKDGSVRSNRCKAPNKRVMPKYLVGITSAINAMLLTCAIICCLRRMNSSSITPISFSKNTEKSNQGVESFMINCGPSIPNRYNFSDVKRITNSFKDKLGQGGYGCVYKGKLLDGRLVAVKILNESKGNGEEFVNEVASISRTSHINIVSLLGFCLEGNKRALIYEFMANGSLEKFIWNESVLKINQHLGWKKLYEIALGIARGLEYLHRGCNTRIVHFDIKPHNILLDEDFCPKIADFGLAKLCTRKDSIVSMSGARGTIGYIAPEVFSKYFGGVSYKSDVYSYGMMVLDMVGERKNDEDEGDHSTENYFPESIYSHLELDNRVDLDGTIALEDVEIVKKMTLVGLWCIQTNPSARPCMNKVIEMLEGSVGILTIPPKPFMSTSSPSCSSATPIT